jgi:NADH dehydrogenase [ubiquinone] 1 alpha subcomplex assembly factor 7
LWIADTWEKLGSPAPFYLVELGPGRGTLMRDILETLKKISAGKYLMQKTGIILVETGKKRRKEQKNNLKDHPVTIRPDLHSLPESPCLFLANEFFDALPVYQFVKTPEGWREMVVVVRNNALTWAYVPTLRAAVYREESPDFTVRETCPAAQSLFGTMTGHIKALGGGLVVVDYGYAVPTGNGTVRGIKNHRFTDPLENPGEQDLTADVNFQELVEIGKKDGLNISGPVSQGNFLKNLGIEQRMIEIEEKDTINDVKRLINEDEMGTLYKIMGVFSEKNKEISGFYHD